MQTKLCRFLEKKIPSNKEDMLESFNIDRVVQSDYYKCINLCLGNYCVLAYVQTVKLCCVYI